MQGITRLYNCNNHFRWFDEECQGFSCLIQLDQISRRSKFVGWLGVGAIYIHRQQNQLVVHLNARYLVYQDQYCILQINLQVTE